MIWRVPLEPGELTWAACAELAPKIREGDLLECENGALAALLSGMQHGGEAITIVGPSDLLGAFGYTRHGTIWSLFRDMSYSEAMTVLKRTPEWVANLVNRSGMAFLYNWVAEENKTALGWLGASRCFEFDLNPVTRTLRGGLERRFIYFRTRPEMAHV